MRSSDLKSIIDGLRDQIASRFGVEGVGAIATLSQALERFEDRPIDEFSAQLAALKPKKSAKRSPKKSSERPGDLVEKYTERLRGAIGDSKLLAEVMTQIRADKHVLKAEALAIAQGVGVRATSKTTKVLALSQIEGLSAQSERDRITAERIRKGA